MVGFIYMSIGVLATVIMGIIGVKISLKLKSKTELLYFENRCISLFKSVVKDLNELEIKYKGEIVNENLINYKGTFLNAGNKDIDKNLIYEPLKVKLPKGYEWKKVNIIEKSEGINIDKTINSEYLEFNWDILKESEYFIFDSIIEYKPEDYKGKEVKEKSETVITDNLSRYIRFKQRITNLKVVKKEKVKPKPTFLKGFLMPIGFLILLILGCYDFSIRQIIDPEYEFLLEYNTDSLLKYLDLDEISKDKVVFIDESGKKYEYKINEKSEVFDIFSGKIKVAPVEVIRLYLYSGISLILILSFILIIAIDGYYKNKKRYIQVKKIFNHFEIMDS